jgi:hypothetical protein
MAFLKILHPGLNPIDTSPFTPWSPNSSTGYGTFSDSYTLADTHIYYVRSTGGDDDLNDGLSYEAAFQTLDHVVSVAVSGDTVYLEGTFDEYNEIQTGNRTDWITYISYNSESPAVINGLSIANAANYNCYLRFDNIDFACNNDSNITSTNIPVHNIWEAVDANYIEMRNCEIHEYLNEYFHMDKAVRFTGDYVLFYKCHVHASQSGIWGIGDNYTIAQCYIHNTAGGPPVTLYGTNWIVEDCNLNDSNWDAEHLCAIHTGVTYNYVEGSDASAAGYDGTGNNEDYDGLTVGCAYIRDYTELTLNPHNSGIAVWNGSGIIRRNIIHDCGNTSGLRFYPNLVDHFDDILIENCLIYDTHNQIYPVTLEDCGDNIVFRNNTVVGSLRNPSGITYARNLMYGAVNFALADGYDGSGIYYYNNVLVGHTSGWVSEINTKNNILWSVTGYPSSLTDNIIVCDPTALAADFPNQIAYFDTNFFNGITDYSVDFAFEHKQIKDFTLDALSPAIGYGDTDYQPGDSLGSILDYYIQVNGNARNLNNHDAGCYQ